MFDSHMHTPLCHHAIGTPIEYAQVAKEQGLTGICFTEHIPLPDDADAHVRLKLAEVATYRELIFEARDQTDFEIRCGLEMDFIPEIEAFSQTLLEAHNWDYVIGSVHRVGELAYGVAPHPDDLERYWRAYYALVARAAKSGLYDSIGHLDLPRRWLQAPEHHLEMVLPVLDVIAKHGLALDLNTSGMRGDLKATHPPLEFLAEAKKRNIPLVLGSDAHNPDHVGSHFEEVIKLIKSVGYTEVVAFEQRQLEKYAI